MNLKQIIFYEDKYLFDFSDYSQDSNSFDHVNKKVIDQMKGEFKGKIVGEIVRLNSKMDSFIALDGKESME